VRELSSKDRKYLRSQAHRLKALVMVGKQGVTDTVIRTTDEVLAAHELMKVRFVERKDEKRALVEEIEKRTGSACAGIIGHVAILYRQHADPDKRRYRLP
jgi:RNA-binding protein